MFSKSNNNHFLKYNNNREDEHGRILFQDVPQAQYFSYILSYFRQKFEKLRMGMDIHTLSEKYFRAEEEIKEYDIKREEIRNRIKNIDEEIEELSKKKKELINERDQLVNKAKTLFHEQSVMSRLLQQSKENQQDLIAIIPGNDVKKTELTFDTFNIGGCLFAFTSEDMNRFKGSFIS
nr:unnamed protein product [Naegleria fowleri]